MTRPIVAIVGTFGTKGDECQWTAPALVLTALDTHEHEVPVLLSSWAALSRLLHSGSS